MITLEACKGCREDFYNGRQNADGGTRCWSAAKGTMVTRYRIGWWTRPDAKGAYSEVSVPSCFREPGVAAYHERLPDFVKIEDVVRRRSA